MSTPVSSAKKIRHSQRCWSELPTVAVERLGSYKLRLSHSLMARLALPHSTTERCLGDRRSSCTDTARLTSSGAAGGPSSGAASAGAGVEAT